MTDDFSGEGSGSSKYWDVNPKDIDVELEGEHDLYALNMDLTKPVVPSNLDDATEENQQSLVPFAKGSETPGSITYPATRCVVTAIRPTFGMVGRTGVMSISESLRTYSPPYSSAT
ncbi:Glutamyl-tRNA(Gln) amidotransferase subunit [Nymphaea thermarum]|nr:Glutamyl-tRNA(Gln) amidotransferase subunit [Nymphaea thermarum]